MIRKHKIDCPGRGCNGGKIRVRQSAFEETQYGPKYIPCTTCQPYGGKGWIIISRDDDIIDDRTRRY